METINHEYYVSLEVARLLKEARFDWKTEYAYVDELFCPMRSFSSNFNSWGIKIHEFVSAPTLDVAQRWLREVTGWEAQVAYGFDEDCHKTYVTECGNPEGDLENYIVYFPTYEEAQEAGIKKCLEIILEKGGNIMKTNQEAVDIPREMSVQEVEREQIKRALEKSSSLEEASARLGISVSSLRRKIKEYKL